MRHSAWVPVCLWMGFIFYGSSLPGSDIPSIFPFQDVVYHCIIYAILGFLVARAGSRSAGRPLRRQGVLLAALIGIAYGLSDEFHQTFVPLRSASGLDVLADGAGAESEVYCIDDRDPAF